MMRELTSSSYTVYSLEQKIRLNGIAKQLHLALLFSLTLWGIHQQMAICHLFISA